MLRLYELRQQAGISQKKLAEELNMSAGNLCDWEKGRTQPDIEKLIRLADYFDESLDYLVGREEVRAQGKDLLKYRLLHAFNQLPKESRESLVTFLEKLQS